MKTILVVDDTATVRQLLTEYLSEQGYTVITAENGRVALLLLEKQQPDLILLDVMMPKMDGFQTITRIRKQSNVPIIMVTAKRHESDVVRGFELGADDYITKPFKMRVLLMRMRAVLRRATPVETADPILIIGKLVIDTHRRQIMMNDTEIELTPIEFCLLERLGESAEHTLSRAALCTHLIEHGYTGSESTLKIHIRNLRQKIEPNPADPTLIETVFGIGYRLRGSN